MTGAAAGLTERLLRRDRAVLAGALGLAVLLAWAWLVRGAGTGMTAWEMTRLALFPHAAGLPEDAGGMAGMAGMADMPGMADAGGWTAGRFLLIVAMWWVMMVAMMLPSAAPLILLHARTLRHAQAKGRVTAGPVPSLWFVGGYLAVWLAFSVGAASAQTALGAGGLISAAMLWSESRWLSAGLLAVAALWQVSPAKRVCLARCRSPAETLARGWRPGAWGAFRMGVGHGGWCLGCCWALMALLFVGGVMNLVWIAALGVLVLVEKLAPWGGHMAPVAGGVLAAWASATLLV